MPRIRSSSPRGTELADYMSRRPPGTVFTAVQLCTELGLPGTEEDSVGKKLAYLSQTGVLDRIRRGRYVYRGVATSQAAAPAQAAESEPVLDEGYELVGRTSSGDIIVAGMDSKIVYKLVEM